MTKMKIVIAGGGFGGVYAYVALHKFFHKNKDVELSIASNQNYFLFTPLLHEVAAGSIHRENIIESLRENLHCCLASFYECTVHGVDLTSRTLCTSVKDIPYDYAVIALGAKTNYFGIDPKPSDFTGKPPIFDFRAAVHHDFQPGGFGGGGGFVVAHAKLHPKHFGADFDGVGGNGRHGLGGAKAIHDIDS